MDRIPKNIIEKLDFKNMVHILIKKLELPKRIY